MIFCDSDGRLSLTAVAATRNGKELADVMTERLQAEVLFYKMDVEEPNAAAIISEALNHPAQMAMRTTELTAVAVLKEKSCDRGRVGFQSARSCALSLPYCGRRRTASPADCFAYCDTDTKRKTNDSEWLVDVLVAC